MAVVINQSRKLLITQLKSELNYRLSVISSRMQRIAMEQADIAQQKATIQNAQIKKLQEQGVENITVSDIDNIALLTSDLDVELTLLAVKDDEMEAEMKSIETQLQALNAEEEQIDKTLDNSIKKEYGIFSNS